jgi:formylglycine-generating enzyme required for sulfatase activity
MSLNKKYWSNAIVNVDSLGGEYCFVPKSVFIYGKSRETVEIQAEYYLGRYPVTKSEFLGFVAATNYDYSDEDIRIMNILCPQPECPATPISWADAKAYARWMRKKTGEYYSLPSEYEWEAGSRGDKGVAYPWGDDSPKFSHAHFSSDGIPSVMTIPIKSKPLNESDYGVCDTVGNVWEWCLDSFDDTNEIHVLRGGSCVESIDSCNCTAKKYCIDPHYRLPYAGFRLIYLPGELFNLYRMAANSSNQNTYTDTASKTIFM